ncbi:MAG: protein kinase [Chthonomonadales bacterium]|nr:protein kinase [Chthonomonadales bacterium]
MAVTTDIIARKYKIVREIARSNDVVYEAVDITMGRRLAIKELLIPPNLTGAARAERVERFNREARAAGKLSHHNIVTVYDFGEDNGRYYIAMEYLEGGTLRDTLQARGALAPPEAVDIGSQVLSALAHAHAHSVIHRDVKPDNIHMLPDGLIKLTDFGIARLSEEASLTGDGQVFGTPSYMSPEQIEGRFVDHRSDLFSLGVVLYEMVAGRKPFTGDSVVSITYAIMHAEPPPLMGVPYPLERIISRALSKDPSMRYQSAAEMRAALKDSLALPAAFSASPPQAAQATVHPNAAPAPLGSPSAWSPTPSPWQPPAPAGTVPPVYTGAGPQPPAPQSGAVVGPFATWGSPQTAAPSPQAPPSAPFVRPREPLIGPGVRTFLNIMTISFVLAAILLGSVLLFVRSYEQHRSYGAVQALQMMMAEAAGLVQSGDLEGAASKYERVLAASPRSPEGRVARTNLATVLNRLGIRAADLGRLDQAAARFQAVLDLYARLPDGLSQTDLQELANAQENLDAVVRLRGRSGVPSGESGRLELRDAETSPSTGAPSQSEALAREYLAAGLQAQALGDLDAARECWTRAIGAAPGTESAMMAQRLLDQTTTPPRF